MWNPLGFISDLLDWIVFSWFEEEPSDWYDVLLRQAIMVLMFVSFTYAVTYHPRKVYKRWQEAQIDKRIAEIKRRYKGIKVREAIFYHLNFGQDKNVPIGAFVTGTDLEDLSRAIKMIEDAIDKEMEFTSKLFDYIPQFIKEVTGDDMLPEELELEDVLALLNTFADYLEKKEPILGKIPQPGEVIYPPGLEKRVQEMEELIKRTDHLVPSRRTGSLRNVSQKEQIEEMKTALRDFNELLRKRSDETYEMLVKAKKEAEKIADAEEKPIEQNPFEETLMREENVTEEVEVKPIETDAGIPNICLGEVDSSSYFGDRETLGISPRSTDMESDLPPPEQNSPRLSDISELDLPPPKRIIPRSTDMESDLPPPEQNSPHLSDISELDLPPPKRKSPHSTDMGSDLPPPKCNIPRSTDMESDLPPPEHNSPRLSDISESDLPPLEHYIHTNCDQPCLFDPDILTDSD